MNEGICERLNLRKIKIDNGNYLDNEFLLVVDKEFPLLMTNSSSSFMTSLSKCPLAASFASTAVINIP